MSQAKPLKYLEVLILGIVIILGTSCQPHSNAKQESPEIVLNPNFNFRPNILWLVAEDMSPNIPAFGDSTIVTTTLNRLAAEGVSYDNFYTPHPVCAPARAAIITGMYANHIGASHMRTGPWYSDNVPKEAVDAYSKRAMGGLTPYEAVPPPEVRMFTEYLRAEGYYCTNNSKQDYQFKKTLTAWDENSDEAHWRNRPKGKPFFSVFNFGVTHESRIWAKAEDSLWVDADLEVPIPPYLPDNDVGKRDVRRMYSNILEMDAQIGRVLAQLEEDGLLDSTIIFWYTDHGGPLPRQKRLLHDSGIKVPMIIRYPGRSLAGERDDRMVSFIDLAPTVLSLVGIQPKEYMDGTAFLGEYVRDIEPQYVYGAADRFDETMDQNRSVRDKRFKYIRYDMPDKPMFLEVAYRNQMPIMQELLRLRDNGELTEEQLLWFRSEKPREELFDLENDPHEIRDLAGDPSYSDKLSELRKACELWVQRINDTGMIEEKDLIESMWPEQVQPITADPIIMVNGTEASISCETEGASIGFKVIQQNDKTTDSPWNVYTGPFEIPENSQLVTVAHRIGYKRSREISY